MPAPVAIPQEEAVRFLYVLPELHSPDGKQLTERLYDVYKHASQYNKEALDRAYYPKKEAPNLSPTSRHTLRIRFIDRGQNYCPNYETE